MCVCVCVCVQLQGGTINFQLLDDLFTGNSAQVSFTHTHTHTHTQGGKGEALNQSCITRASHVVCPSYFAHVWNTPME